VISKPFAEDEFKLLLLDAWMESRGGEPQAPLRVATSLATD
jgi:hypothetical protein